MDDSTDSEKLSQGPNIETDFDKEKFESKVALTDAYKGDQSLPPPKFNDKQEEKMIHHKRKGLQYAPLVLLKEKDKVTSEM